MKYIFILKNEKTKNYRAISQLLVFFNLLGFVLLLINSEERLASNFWLLFSIVATAVYNFFTVIEWVSKKPVPDFWHRSIFGYCAIAWFIEGLWWISILLALFVMLDSLANRKLIVKISEKEINLPLLPAKNVHWKELNNVILKDDLLTIDFKNNKLFQHLILNSDWDVDEKEFNNFCSQQLDK